MFTAKYQTLVLIFCYGSNMCSSRLNARINSARWIGIAKLYQHILRFNKISIDGSGKCDVMYTGIDGHFVWGIIVEIDPVDKEILDYYEDHGKGYLDKVVEVELESGQFLKAITYYAIKIGEKLIPYDWYLDFVIAGAREHGLPEDYIQKLEQIQCIPDPQAERAIVNREILYG